MIWNYKRDKVCSTNNHIIVSVAFGSIHVNLHIKNFRPKVFKNSEILGFGRVENKWLRNLCHLCSCLLDCRRILSMGSGGQMPTQWPGVTGAGKGRYQKPYDIIFVLIGNNENVFFSELFKFQSQMRKCLFIYSNSDKRS